MERKLRKTEVRAASAKGLGGDVPPKRKTATVTLRVENSDGDMTVSPTKLTLPSGGDHTVTWRADPSSPVRILSFECFFYEGTPLDGLAFNEKQPTGRSRGDAELRVYHYSVAVTTPTRIVQITGCPEVIIR